MAEKKGITSTPPPSRGRFSTQPLHHEKSLSHKVAQGSEAGEILNQQLISMGTHLVTQLNVLFKNARIHGRNNAALDYPANVIVRLASTLGHERPVTLRVQNDFLFLGEHHLKGSAHLVTVFMGLIDSLNAWQIGAISLAPTVTSKELCEFANLFGTLDPATHTLSDLKQRMKEQGIEGIELEVPVSREGRGREGTGGAGEGLKRVSKQSYGEAASAVGSLVKSIKEGGRIGFKQAKRAIQNIVDLMLYDESALLGLTNLRCHDEYTYNHSVNVALLSLALGNRAGYPKIELADLGLAALFHDMGKATIPIEVLNKPGEFTEEEWQMMRNHPTEAVLELTKARGITSLPGRMAAAAFEHHMNYDLSGYPKIAGGWMLSLTGRILMIADCYDAMTSSRVYRREPIPPSRVLEIMNKKSGQSFDPVLFKLFVTCVGIIPIGSLVLLDTNELAVVTKAPKDRNMADRPSVKIITDPDGNPIEGPDVDLSEGDPENGYPRTIVRLVDNTEYRFDTARYFV